MKIKELLYETPEMTEEKLLEIIKSELHSLKKVDRYLIGRLIRMYGSCRDMGEIILKEFDLIQDKKSYLTRSQRNLLTGFVGSCMIKMTKGNGDSGDTNESTSDDRLESISHVEEVGDSSEG